jgi:peptide/nickel transport system ATP-binding protein/oligopeptide transport system ATP-binding protein
MSATAAAPAGVPTLERRLARGEELLRVEGLTKHFPIKRRLLRPPGTIRAVEDVSFSLAVGETLGLVGESGCGKSTVARTVMRLLEPTSGRILFKGQDISRFTRAQLRPVRREMQVIFQDPFASLNPRMTVHDIVGEPLRIHGLWRDGGPARVSELLEMVGLSPEHGHRYPHEFSGGQRQRVGVARALALNPQLVILDEPVSALDVSIQAQVINLLRQLQDELELSYLFIAHDLSVVRHISDRVAVMYLGKIVEMAPRDQVYGHATHPYTQALLSAVPYPDPDMRGLRERIVLEGDVPSPANPPSGCRFRTRCWKADERCAAEAPELEERAAHPHPSACHYAEERRLL